MLRYLLIVARDQPNLHDYLSRQSAGDEKVRVLVDRQRADRRRQRERHEPERRRGDRRSGTGKVGTLFQHGLLLVRRLQEAECQLSALVRRMPAEAVAVEEGETDNIPLSNTRQRPLRPQYRA